MRRVLNALQTLAPNTVKAFAEVMAASTAHLSNIKDVKVIDFGGNGSGGSSVGKFGAIPVEILTKMFEGLAGTGFDASRLFKFLGIKPEDVLKSTPNDAPKTKTDKK